MNRSILVGLLIGLPVACVPPGNEDSSGQLGVEIPEVEESSSLALVFEEASEEAGVPVDVLKALAYVETRFLPASGDVEFEGQAAPFGLFALGGERLDRAASLSGLVPDEAMRDDRADVQAAANLLRALADDADLPDEVRDDPLAWGPALAGWNDFDEEMGVEFAEDVLDVVRRGAAVPLADGTTIVIGRNDVEAAIAMSEQSLSAAGTVWRPSPNHNSRGGSSVELVVIHTCEGSYAGCVSWLRNTRASASAHYVVKENGSEVSQLVDENRRAWHIAASYRPHLNSGRLSHRSGQSSNTFSIGIEHGGRASQSSWPTGQINRSVSLVRDITARHNIPRDRYHIVGHGQLQPESRSDPGPNWPWTSYLAAIGAGSSGNPGNPPPSSGAVITVDNTTSGRFRASGNWDYSSWASGRVGSNYRYRVPQATSDTASYKVNVPSAGRYEVFARVPGNGYNTNVPYIIHHAGGTAIVHKNISSSGARWVSLGTYSFNRVDDWIVQISCWTNGSGYLIADAVKLERR